MRPSTLRAVLAAVALACATSATGAGAGAEESLKVFIDRSKVDLPHHKVEVKLSRPAEKIRLKVFGDSGTVLAEVEKKFDGAPAGTPLEMTWTPSSDEPVAKVEVWGHDTKGYYAGVAIIPWSVTVPHQEVNFPSDSDVIQPADVPKLEASLKTIAEIAQKHAGLGNVTLFVLGHTDTMGTPEHNLTLSRKRARAIAAWFRSHKLAIPIAFEGAGERMLLVKTDDEVDEPRNRRVDYILALEPPTLPAADLSWKTP